MDVTSLAVSEKDIVQTYLRPLAIGWPGAYDLLDDCASITPAPGQDIIVKTDPIRSGLHFFIDDQPSDIAWKALATNVSDIAAKAARPIAYTLALSFPNSPERNWLESFSTGLAEAQDAFGCILIGGDLDLKSDSLSISVTMFGEIPKGRMLRRGNAQPGDSIFVSGTLGDSAFGLHLRTKRVSADDITDYSDLALTRYLRPEPRLGLRSALRSYARAATDISDGLPNDLKSMCGISGLGAYINAEKLPFSAAMQNVAAMDFNRAISLVAKSDDYEILCAVPQENCEKFISSARSGRVKVTKIGEFSSDSRIQLRIGLKKVIEWS
ncbi:MAG: Thiamine-monophosphate kinase [Hyphomicrobiaceae bacterium hypho_1]